MAALEARTRRKGEPSASDASLLVRGVSPVLEVPFDDEGAVDYDGFRRVVRYVLGTGVSSVMFPGFASEYHKLSETERSELTEILLSESRGRDDVAAIIAVQDHATVLAVERCQAAIEAGADLINLLPPHFLSPSRDALARHIRTILAAISPVPVVLQYAPLETGTSLDTDTLHAIAADHDNLALVKVESSPPGPFIAQLAAGQPPLPALEGYAGVQLPDAIRRGAVGTQPGCSFTEIYVEIWRRYAAGETTDGDDLHRRLSAYVSYWMLHTELIVAAEKLVSMRRGLIASAHCREPAHHLDAEEVRMIDRFLDEFAAMLPRLDEREDGSK